MLKEGITDIRNNQSGFPDLRWAFDITVNNDRFSGIDVSL